jgi:hypothetical protein
MSALSVLLSILPKFLDGIKHTYGLCWETCLVAVYNILYFLLTKSPIIHYSTLQIIHH